MEFKRRREMKKTKIEIIPMIDTIFFLLVFFMLSSLSMVQLKGVPVNLPKAATGSHQNARDVTVTIDARRQVYVDREPVALANLGAVMLEKAGGPDVDLDTSTLLINADLTVPHGLVVTCIDTARQVGISHFAIVTAPEDTHAAR